MSQVPFIEENPSVPSLHHLTVFIKLSLLQPHLPPPHPNFFSSVDSSP